MNYKTNLIKIFILGFIIYVTGSCQKETDRISKVETVPDSVLQFREIVKKELLQKGFRSVEFEADDVIIEGDMLLPLNYLRKLYYKKQSEESSLKSTEHRGYNYDDDCSGWWFWKECVNHRMASQTAVDYITIRTEDTYLNKYIIPAINKWNQTGSNVYMLLVTGSSADITIARGGWDDDGAVARSEVGHEGNVGSRIIVYNEFNGRSDDNSIAILMHELGHNLGFAHTNEPSAGGTYQITGTPTSDANSVFNQGAMTTTFSSGDLTAIRLLWPAVNRCPYIGSFDGANCYIGKAPSGTSAFISGNYFYYSDINGSCPYPGSWFNGTDCVVAYIPSGASPFILNNSWYVQPY